MIPKEISNLCKTTKRVNWYESDLNIARSYIAAIPESPTENELAFHLQRAYDQIHHSTVTDLASECQSFYGTIVDEQLRLKFTYQIIEDLLVEYFTNGCMFRNIQAAAPPPRPANPAQAVWDLLQPARPAPIPIPAPVPVAVPWDALIANAPVAAAPARLAELQQRLVNIAAGMEQRRNR